MKRFWDVLMVVGIFSLAFIIPVGLNRLTAPTPSKSEPAQADAQTEEQTAGVQDTKIPLDVPIPDGAYLTDSKQLGRTSDLITFSLPKVSSDDLWHFYDEEMTKLGWTKFFDQDNQMKFHKEDGQRKVFITFFPSSSRPKLTIETDQTW